MYSPYTYRAIASFSPLNLAWILVVMHLKKCIKMSRMHKNRSFWATHPVRHPWTFLLYLFGTARADARTIKLWWVVACN